MKKTLFIAALAASCGFNVASAMILTFTDTDGAFPGATYNRAFSTTTGTGNGPGSSWSETVTFSDGTKFTIGIDSGRIFSQTATETTWSNTEVLTDLNTALGTSITAEQVGLLNYVSSKAQSAHMSLTLNYGGNSAFSAGSEMVYYAFVTLSSDSNGDSVLTNISVTGLDNAQVSWALPGGTGYETGSMNIGQGTLGLVKVTGTLTETQEVTLSSTSPKNGWAALMTVPEPTTATLSLVALAGLCSRRRRKK